MHTSSAIPKTSGMAGPLPADSIKDKQQYSDALEAICNPEKSIKSAAVLFPKSVQASHIFELVNLLRPTYTPPPLTPIMNYILNVIKILVYRC